MKGGDMPLFLHCSLASIDIAWHLIIRELLSKHHDRLQPFLPKPKPKPVAPKPVEEPRVRPAPSVPSRASESDSEDDQDGEGEKGPVWYHEWDKNESRIKERRPRKRASRRRHRTPGDPVEAAETEPKQASEEPKPEAKVEAKRETKVVEKPSTDDSLDSWEIVEERKEKTQSLLQDLLE
jgi:hypothetical protein